ncbi:MAG: arsenic efflux protein [Clostridia bacterium]|nr:arsenic efflux protein [Clostridia bacterium]
MWEVLLEAVLDSVKLFPFLILLYIIIEIAEEKISTSKQFVKYTNGKYATVVGAGLGLVPQCGFSVVASDLYSRKYIRMGTLLAIFIATSDEAIPIILSNPDKAYLIFPILAIKFVFALVVGYGVDLVYNLICKHHTIVEIVPPSDDVDIHDHDLNGCCGHDVVEERNNLKQFFVHPLIHSLKILLYIFIVNLVLSTIIHFVGEENVVGFMQRVKFVQPLIVPLVGLIPNCASSVLITQLLLLDGISFGSAVAGLCVNAGIGLAVLFKQNKSIKENLTVLGILYGTAVILGYIITLFEVII